MRSASTALLVLIGVALLVNYLQGGPTRVKRWTRRTLTGKDTT